MAELDPAQADEDAHIGVTIGHEGDIPVLFVTGEIDLATSVILRQAVGAAVTRSDGTVVFDLGGVTFMDSSGLSLLLHVAAGGSAVIIRSPSPMVRRVIETTGVADTLRMEGGGEP